MNKKIVWLIVSCLMVAALVLASCAPAVVEEKEAKVVTKEPEKKVEEVEEVVEKVGPQYGGRLTYINMSYNQVPRNWDITEGDWQTQAFMNPYMSYLVFGDIETYGPRGTNECAFNMHQEVPEEFLGGDLAESWEISEDKLVFHLRHGAMYAGNTHIGMAPREVTADDIVFELNHLMAGPLGKGATKWVENIYAEGKYTVVVEMKQYSYLWCPELISGMGCGMYPPETIEAGSSDWRNQAGSGPFILTDYVKGSMATYKRNPNHWWKTTINGKEYQLPFVDELRMPVIVDELTMISAIRTGKIDAAEYIDSRYKDTLAQVPELIAKKYPSGGCECLSFQCAHGIFTDREVRRALMIGIDMPAYIETALNGEGFIHPMFSPGTPFYTPLEELPQSTRELFEYNPEKAKQMLADAGYPNGFNTEIVMKPSDPVGADCAAFLVDQWAKIGVNATLIPLERTVHEAIRFSRDFNGVYLRGDAIGATTELPQRKTECASLAASWNDPYFDEQLSKAQKLVDPVARASILKEMGVYFIDDVGNGHMPGSYKRCYWWPWVNGWYGETEVGYRNNVPALARIWIDQDLKKEMGH